MLIDAFEQMKKILKITKNLEFYIENGINSASIISNLTEDLLTLAKIKNDVFELNIERNINLLEIAMEAFKVMSFNAE